MERINTRPIKVGNVQIGGQNKVVIQSMTNTKTKDIKETVNQILELEKAGCEIIRVACLDLEDAKAIEKIKKQIHIPIVADIHFDYKIALEAIKSGVDKIRINPGNIGKKENVKKVVEACRKKNIPIRIGVNGGSLEKDLLEKYGKPTAEAMVESAKRHVKILEELEFFDIAISLKASNLDLCIKAYECASKEFNYPLHLGITEAGTEFSGTIKSSIGLGILLKEFLIVSIYHMSTNKQINKNLQILKIDHRFLLNQVNRRFLSPQIRCNWFCKGDLLPCEHLFHPLL